ncbi:MAG: outer membrane protein, partial [Dongiaceae bacterium]
VFCCAIGDDAPAALADGFYVNLHGGPRYLKDADLSRDPHGEPLRVGRLDFKNIGGTVGVAGGYAWDNGLAVEGEFAYRRNGLDHDEFDGDSTDLDGTLSSYAWMANGYYRLDTGTDFTPYIGGGVGIALLDLDMRRGDEGRFHALDTDTQFAYQGIAGISYALAPHWSVGVDYRFFGTQDPSFIDHPDGNRVWTETVYHAHEVLLGVTYDFN